MIELFAINYRNPQREPMPVGGIAKEFVVGLDDNGVLPVGYAELRAPYHIWSDRGASLDIVGFHGYRKHLDFRPGSALRWHECDTGTFRAYQDWLTQWDGERITKLLAKHQIITNNPYDCSVDGNLGHHFKRTRSPADWEVLHAALKRYADRHDIVFDFSLPYVRDFFIVTTGKVFNEYMEFWEFICSHVEHKLSGEDLTSDGAYAPRAMSYISQWIFTLWLAQRADLNPIDLPRLTSWGIH